MSQHHHEHEPRRSRSSWATRVKLTIKIIGLVAGLAGSFYAGGEVDDVFDDDRDDCVETSIDD